MNIFTTNRCKQNDFITELISNGNPQKNGNLTPAYLHQNVRIPISYKDCVLTLHNYTNLLKNATKHSTEIT